MECWNDGLMDMTGTGWIWLEWLERARNDWKLLEMTGNSWKAGNDWMWLKMVIMAGNG